VRRGAPLAGWRRSERAGRECLRAAWESGQPAEFASTFWTIEGDPFTVVYRVLSRGQLEVFDDASQDHWGSGEWSFRICTQLRGTGPELWPEGCSSG
jgi:hypothetical protein